jgi:retron-type reverse transcriptase
MVLISLAGTTKVQSNGKFRCTPSVENFNKFPQKVKTIVNCSNYGAKVKAEKLAPIVRGWRNYHKFCNMNGPLELAIPDRKQDI